MYAKALREESANISAEMHGIMSEAAKRTAKNLTPEEALKFDNLMAAYDKNQADIKRAESAEKIELELSANPARHQVAAILDKFHVDNKGEKDLHTRAFENYLKGGVERLTPEEKDFLNKEKQRFANTMSTTTGSQGGYTVPIGFSGQLEAATKWFGGADALGSFTTETGNPIQWPTVDDTAVMGEIIGQNTAVSRQDVAFGQLTFSAYIFSSREIIVPEALLDDSFFDLPGFLVAQLGLRLSRILNLKLTKGAGSGSGEPLGVIPAVLAAGGNTVLTTGHATALAFDDFTDLEYSVDKTYRSGAQYMFHDKTEKLLKKLKDNNLRPLWLPALSGTAADSQKQETINGYGYVINNDMDQAVANGNSVLFGQLSKYKCRKIARGTTVKRLVERYAESLQQAFFGYARYDGGLVSAGASPMTVLTQSAT